MDIEKIIKQKGYDVEVSYSQIWEDSFYFEGKKCKHPSSSSTSSLIVRVSKNGKTGTCTTNSGNWEECLKTAKKICRVSKKREYYGIPKKSKYAEINTFDRKIREMEEEELKRMGEEIIAKSKARVIDAEIRKTIGKTIFANSNGIYVEEMDSTLSSSISVKSGNSIAYESHTSNKKEDLTWIGERASELCLKSKGKKKGKTGVYDVFMDYFAISDIFSLLAPSFYANNIQEGNSRLMGKIGERVFSKKLSIIDDGTLKNGLFSGKADSEGVPRQRTILAKKGVLKGFLYDFTTSKKEGKKSTGNCSSILKKPGISCSNFIINNGRRKTGDMFSDFDGIYVNMLVGMHTANPVSGDFSVNTENAFLIKKGEWIPLKHVMIAGNIFELLNNIQEIGREKRQESNVMSPPIIFSNVQVIA